MPDITMCVNEECKFKLSCYRCTAEPNQYRQSYASFEPEGDGCDYFIPAYQIAAMSEGQEG
tara:strand:+ start:2257 stop:2439 length:183 start_codon:yes stop_codon:yes gene_type:complete